MRNKRILANGLLLLTAFIWGVAFVAQRVGMEYIGPFTFNGARFFLATLVLIPVTFFMEGKKKQNRPAETKSVCTPEEQKKQKKLLLLGGICCGTFLFCGATFQQVGLVFTTASKSAFITALYIVLVPVFSLLLKHKPSIQCWIGVVFGAIGLYLLCITESFQIARGDFIVLVGAFFWTGHVLTVDHFVTRGVSAVKLSLAQFAFCTLLSFCCMFLFEKPAWSAICSCAVLLLYTGVLSAGVGFTLQVIGQKYTNPTVASLLMSMESVFGALSGVILLHEILSLKELCGCAFMFAAIIISQIPKKGEFENYRKEISQ